MASIGGRAPPSQNTPMPSSGSHWPAAARGLQGLDPLLLRRVRASPQALVALGLPIPLAQCLGRAADLRRDRADGRPLRGVVAPVFQDHPHRPLPDLRRKAVRRLLRHDPILSTVGASAKPGAVHLASLDELNTLIAE